MDTDAIKALLAMIARHGLSSAAGYLVANGYLQSSETQSFIGGGLLVLSIAWSWWQKSGQTKVAALLKKLTDKPTVATAVAAAQAAPPGAAKP